MVVHGGIRVPLIPGRRGLLQLEAENVEVEELRIVHEVAADLLLIVRRPSRDQGVQRRDRADRVRDHADFHLRTGVPQVGKVFSGEHLDAVFEELVRPSPGRKISPRGPRETRHPPRLA